MIQFFKSDKPKRKRTSYTPAQRAELLRLQDLKELKRENPDAYWRLRMKELLGVEAGKSELKFDDIGRVITMLKTLGLKVVPASASGAEVDESGILGLLDRVMNSAAGERLAETIGGAAMGLMAPKHESARSTGNGSPTGEAIRSPAENAYRELQQPQIEGPEQPQDEDEEQDVATQVQMLINELETKRNGAEIADMLVSIARFNPKLKQMLADFIRVPPDNLRAYLDDLVQKNPAFAPLGDWARSHWPLFLDAVEQLRYKTGAAATAPQRNNRHGL